MNEDLSVLEMMVLCVLWGGLGLDVCLVWCKGDVCGHVSVRGVFGSISRVSSHYQEGVVYHLHCLKSLVCNNNKKHNLAYFYTDRKSVV